MTRDQTDFLTSASVRTVRQIRAFGSHSGPTETRGEGPGLGFDVGWRDSTHVSPSERGTPSAHGDCRFSMAAVASLVSWASKGFERRFQVAPSCNEI